MNTRNTQQKEIILDILDKNRIHPTIQEIYYLAKSRNHNVGQATVYRNVNKLVEEKKIFRLPIGDEGYRYDINTSPHHHLVCNSCGKIVDIFNSEYENMIHKIEIQNSVTIAKSLLILEGICKDCKNN